MPGVLTRGGIRSSLQSTHRNSFPSCDPDITGNSLGTAGTRRTVYLIDENAATNEEKKEEQPKSESQPSTFLMFNKISNVMGTLEPGSSNGHHHDENKSQKSGTGSDKKKNDKINRENAVWYEYGCV